MIKQLRRTLYYHGGVYDDNELVAEGIVTLDFAMRFLSMSRPTLNKLIERGDLPTVVLVDKRTEHPEAGTPGFRCEAGPDDMRLK